MIRKNQLVPIFQKPYTGEDFEEMGLILSGPSDNSDMPWFTVKFHNDEGKYQRKIRVDSRGDPIFTIEDVKNNSFPA